MEQSHDRDSFRVAGHCLRGISGCEGRGPIRLTCIKKIKNTSRERRAAIDRRAALA
jgi:hypothetical protein